MEDKLKNYPKVGQFFTRVFRVTNFISVRYNSANMKHGLSGKFRVNHPVLFASDSEYWVTVNAHWDEGAR